MANKLNSLAYTKWLCKYHIVFIPKYRRKAIFNQYRTREIIFVYCANIRE
ncbi:transposase, partial [Limosilactobacillus reuteri]